MPITSNEEQGEAVPFVFSKLESLRLLCEQIKQDQVASLNYFKSGVGFKNVRDKGDHDISVSSSATCVISLIATNEWKASRAETTQLSKYLLSRDKSAGLKADNPFTNAWILEAVTAFEQDTPDLFVPDASDKARIKQKEIKLQEAITTGKGGVSIATYPASGYLTQLAVRVLRRRRKLASNIEGMVNAWAWGELARQLALVHAGSKTQDAFAVAYLLILVTAVTPSAKITPEQATMQRAALKTVFRCQLEDGTWPSSRPLFHYPGYGNAYCYEYEMLTQLLAEPGLRDLLLDYLTQLGTSTKYAVSSVYRVEGGVPAWTSGHHPNQAEPESWATASVYHFAHVLDRLLAEAVRRELFRYLESPLPRFGPPRVTQDEFAVPFLDSKLQVGGQEYSLKQYLWDNFVRPLRDEAPTISKGRSFGKSVPRSAILFGPPGTSKTELAREIAIFLGWPHLALDPSHFLRNGMDGMQAEANRIFRMLEESEGVVVLFDEFDELVRERGSSKAEPFSRLLTTAMLPKLARLHKRGTMVFIIATNNIDEFDLAIRREGRFDHRIQVLPPTYKAKMSKEDWGPKKVNLNAMLRRLKIRRTSQVRKQIEDLTFGECEAFATELGNLLTKRGAASLLKNYSKVCTLNTPVSKDDKTTWSQRCKKEAKNSH